jgi:hypothetical protein
MSVFTCSAARDLETGINAEADTVAKPLRNDLRDNKVMGI